MFKIFGCIMESKISAWVEKNGRRAYGQVGFRKHHSTIDHLVTLRVLMEESRLEVNLGPARHILGMNPKP